MQDWLVAFHGEDVLPVSFQDLFDVALVDVECVGGDHDPREVTRVTRGLRGRALLWDRHAGQQINGEWFPITLPVHRIPL